MEVVPFEPGHLDILDPGPYDKRHIEPLRGADLTGSSIFHDGRCLGVFFLADLAGGVMRFYLFAGDELRQKYGRFLARACRDGIDLMRENGVEIIFEEDRRDGLFIGRQAYFHDPDRNVLEISALEEVAAGYGTNDVREDLSPFSADRKG